MSTVIGVDSSTQSCKTLLVEAETGEILRQETRPHPEGARVDPRRWVEALAQSWRALSVPADLLGVGVAGQQHGMVALDADGAPMHEALLWNDTSSAPDSAAMREELGDRTWLRRINSVPVPSFTITKLAWLARTQPELASRVVRVVLPHDYLNLALTGQAVTDRSDASGTGYYDPVADAYLPDLLERFFGRVPGLPEVLHPGESAGALLPEWGPAVDVAPGLGDNAAAALGLGLAEGEVAVSIGTSGTVFAASPKPITDPQGAVAGFADGTGGHLPLLATLNAARVLRSTADLLGVDLEEFSRLAAAAPKDAGGLTLLPYLDGERSPNLPDASGTLLGVRRANLTPEHLAKAAVLGVVNSLADCLELFSGLGARVDKVVLIGGGARSTALQQAAAGLFGVPVEVPVPGEYAALGAARQAAWTAFGDLPSYPRRVHTMMEPDSAGAYEGAREAYVAARRQIHGV